MENSSHLKNKQLRKWNSGFFGHPKPLGSLFFTELWERFSFYGIRPLLVLYMSALIIDGGLGYDRVTASAIVGIFGGSLYLATLPGGWLADNWLGQQRAIWYGAIIIALGHLSIAFSVFEPFFFFWGLIFIVLGTGLFKTCISVMVGELYKEGDPRRDGGFSIFYMGINLGSLAAPFICGVLQQKYGWHFGFGLGGIGMLIALILFRFSTIPQLEKFSQVFKMDTIGALPTNQRNNVGRYVFLSLLLIALLILAVRIGWIVINPVFVASLMTYIIAISVLCYFIYLFFFCGLDKEEKIKLIVCFILFVAAAFFWSAFEQKPTSFNLFAQDYTDRDLGFAIMPTTLFQSFNPLFIILLAPLFGVMWVKLAKRNIEPNSLIKFAFGVIFACLGFVTMYFAAKTVLTSSSQLVSPLWLIVSILLLTLGELFLSPVGLSTMSSLAPKKIQGQVMGLWFAASALGNLVAGLIGGHVSADQIENLPSIFSQCALSLAIIAVVLLILAKPVQKLLLAHKA